MAMTTSRPSPERLQVLGAFTAIYVIYGSVYLFISVMVRHGVPPVASAGVRYALAGILMLAYLRFRRYDLRLDRKTLPATVFSAVLLLCGFGLVAIAQKDVSSGLTSVLIATSPLIVLGLRLTFGRERVAPAAVGGIFLGFAGVGLVLLKGEAARASPEAVVLILICSLAISVGSFLAPRLPLPADSTVSAAWQMLWAGLVLFVSGLAAGEAKDFDFVDVPLNAYLAFIYLVTAGSLVAFTSYVWLLERYPVSRVAAASYVNPLVAVLLGWIFLSESLDIFTLIGGALIVLSVAVTITLDRARGPG